ncbi:MULTISPECIES: permease prefix domain 1-containing protein [unclassified Deinococcus]|uniref:permease prefix domain 1-containing protein n=1 Tax=unclassified Deinococcus TaxID=2623546 RepID=UPI001C30224D|nr:permease prefix domain 1-containing protein [Deinococcus sp. 43]MDK2012223.1 permease prefix domain 1-containing protein [Deinococcus sp. 43]
MTRRLPRPRRPLSADAYIHRATRGLPRAERLDAAAELRAHLTERMQEHQAHGFSPEEAEYLAVRGMGDPHPVNRGLLGHAFTHRAGWLTLAALLVGGLGWTAYREWLPPREGAQFSPMNQRDVNALFSNKDAPRGTYQGVTLTYPRGTKAVLYVTVSSTEDRYRPEEVRLTTKDLTQEEQINFRERLPGSYRYQERLLLSPLRVSCTGQDYSGIYWTTYTMPSPLENSGGRAYSGRGGAVACGNPSVRLHRVTQTLSTTPPSQHTRTVPPEGQGSTFTMHHLLRLNEWRVLYRLRVDPEGDPTTSGAADSGSFSAKARGVYVAVMPLDYVPNDTDGYSWGSMSVGFKGEKPIPLPPLVTDQPGR